MKKCLHYLIASLISIILLLVVIFHMKRTINFSSLKMFDNTNKSRLLNNRIIEDNNEKNKFFLEYYNISLFSYEELKQNFNDLSNNYPIYVVMKYDDENPESNNKYFLLKLVNQTFWGYSYTNNSINENIVYNNSHFELKSKYNNTNNTILNKINIYFYVGKNLTSNKDLLILEKKYFNLNKTIFLFSNVDDIDIDINIYVDKNISLFEAKIRK